ncbi:MAG: hypothetical protein ACRETN_12180 [Nevskiales bacterium]
MLSANGFYRGLLLACCCAAILPAAAQDCPPGNLLAGKPPLSTADVQGLLPLVTDGIVTQEGAIWSAPQALVLAPAASLTYDLGAEYPLGSAYLQADSNDLYTFSLSRDGQQFEDVWSVPFVEGHGLRARSTTLSERRARYVRFGGAQGDGFFSLSELQVFCAAEAQPAVTVVQAPPAVAQEPWWNDRSSARWELALALLALGLSCWRPLAPRLKLRDRLLMVLGVVSFATYFNFGAFHFYNYVHNWDAFHYYVGSKYFRELQYDRMYRCVAVADAQEPELRARVQARKLTNLRSNDLETSAEILAHPELCTRHFTQQRWDGFRHDVAYFRAREGAQRWEDLQTDHGYNATPVWNIAGTLLANLAPASPTQIVLLASLDPLYLALACGMLWWAFGWRVLVVALAVLATNFPARFYWTGGSFLRWDWLFWTVAALCLLKKQKPMLGGAALAYAALLRIFPGFMFAGAVFAAGWMLWRDRRLDPAFKRFFIGAALATVLLLPLSQLTAGSLEAYPRFVENTLKHKETPLTNYMGLRTVVAYRPGEVGRHYRDADALDPWARWKEARLAAYHEASWLYYPLALAFLGLLAFAVRGQQAWVATALGALFIPFGVELTCYYYAFLFAVATLHADRPWIGGLLLATTAFTQFIAWAPLPFMSSWFDEQYTFMSVATLAVFVYIAWRYARERPVPHNIGA